MLEPGEQGVGGGQFNTGHRSAIRSTTLNRLAPDLEALVRGVATYLNTYFIQLVGTRVLESIRLDFFRKLQILPLSFFQKNSTGDLISRGLSDANQLQVTLTTVANEMQCTTSATPPSIPQGGE